MHFPNDLNEYNAQFDTDVIQIAVVIAPSGFGASKGSESDYWLVRFKITAWQDLSNGVVHTEELCLSSMVQDPSELRQKIKEDTIITLKVQRGGNEVLRGFRIVELIEGVNYPKLENILKEQRTLVYHTDNIFGDFLLDKRINRFSKDIKWNDGKARILPRKIYLSFNNDTKERILSSLSIAYELYKNQKEWDTRMRQFAAKELLSLKNEDWLNENEKELTEKDFAKRIIIKGIDIENDGNFSFTYDDNEIFWGHSICVGGNINSGPISADI